MNKRLGFCDVCHKSHCTCSEDARRKVVSIGKGGSGSDGADKIINKALKAVGPIQMTNADERLNLLYNDLEEVIDKRRGQPIAMCAIVGTLEMLKHDLMHEIKDRFEE